MRHHSLPDEFLARNKLETRQRNFPVFHPFFFSFLLLAFSILGKKQEKREEEENTDSTTGSASFCLRQGKEEGKGKGACLTPSSQKKIRELKILGTVVKLERQNTIITSFLSSILGLGGSKVCSTVLIKRVFPSSSPFEFEVLFVPPFLFLTDFSYTLLCC